MLTSVSHTYSPVKQNLRLFFSGDPFILPAMALGDQIRRARHAKRLSQQAIATHFTISRAAVAQWENGTTRPDQDKLAKLASLLGIGLDELLSEGGAMSGPRNASAPPLAEHRELLEAWESLLPGEREALLGDIKRKAAHNREAADHFKPKVIRVADRRKRQIHFDGEDRRTQKEKGDG